MKQYEIKVNSELENMRLDRYLKKICLKEPLSKLFKAIRKGDVLVNGLKVKENYKLQLNDSIIIKYLNVSNIHFGQIVDEELNINKIKINKTEISYFKNLVIFENEDFFVVNKPWGIPMHKGTSQEYGLSEIYKNIYKNNNISFANRLDKETSGLVIGCKTKKFSRHIIEKIRNNEVKKYYFAICKGEVKANYDKKGISELKIENYLETTDQKVIISNKNNKNSKLAKSIFTFYKIGSDKDKLYKGKIKNIFEKDKQYFKMNVNVNDYEKDTVVNVQLITGRKHQIRVQLKHLGHPIKGDQKYGGVKEQGKQLQLICYRLCFEGYDFSLIK